MSVRNYASTAGFTSPQSLDELLSTPGRLTEAIDAERRAKQPPPGWSGLSVLSRADWQMSLSLGDGVRQVEVHPKSPAHRAGIRSENFIQPISLNGAPALPLEELVEAVPMARGDRIIVQFCRHDRGRASGWIPVELVLVSAPRPSVQPDWKTLLQIPCGRRVARSERVKFINEIRARPDVTAGMLKALMVALFKFDNPQNQGIWPSYSTWARELNCSRRAMIEIVKRLRWLGAIKVISGPKKNRASNLYVVTWPAHVAPPQNGQWV
jgi:hypothetical protein